MDTDAVAGMTEGGRGAARGFVKRGGRAGTDPRERVSERVGSGGEFERDGIIGVEIGCGCGYARE